MRRLDLVVQGFRRVALAACLIVYSAYHAVPLYRAWFGPGPFAGISGHYLWPASWSMFTRYSRFHSRVIIEGRFGEKWRRLPMERWAPMRWDTGYRWERGRVMHSRSLQRTFLDAACRKSGAEWARMVRVRWPRRLGEYEQRPRGRVHRRVVGQFRCGSPITAPQGIVL